MAIKFNYLQDNGMFLKGRQGSFDLKSLAISEWKKEKGKLGLFCRRFVEMKFYLP